MKGNRGEEKDCDKMCLGLERNAFLFDNFFGSLSFLFFYSFQLSAFSFQSVLARDQFGGF